MQFTLHEGHKPIELIDANDHVEAFKKAYDYLMHREKRKPIHIQMLSKECMCKCELAKQREFRLFVLRDNKQGELDAETYTLYRLG